MVPERIEKEIVIDAPLDVVWALVTEAEHLGTWFGDSAEIDLRPGGDVKLTWEKHGVARARIEKVEPPHFLSFRWAHPMDMLPAEGNSTLVEFNLRAEGEGTRLRVVESGFPELEVPENEKAKYAAENTQGWELELGELREYAGKVGPRARGCSEATTTSCGRRSPIRPAAGCSTFSWRGARQPLRHLRPSCPSRARGSPSTSPFSTAPASSRAGAGDGKFSMPSSPSGSMPPRGGWRRSRRNGTTA